METVSSKDCSSVDESPISITSSAQVGAPQRRVLCVSQYLWIPVCVEDYPGAVYIRLLMERSPVRLPGSV